MKTKIGFLFAFLLFAFLLFASGCKTYWSKQQKAWNHIESMSDGALLVRLQTGNRTVEALKNAGHPERAAKAREKQKLRNEWIVRAFEHHFDFCPVYFFYSDQSDAVLKGDWSVLMDVNLAPLSPKKAAFKTWYIGEFGLTQDALSKNADPDEIPSVSQGVKSLVLKDGRFVQLRRPFPYQTRLFDDSEAGYAKTVANCNAALKDYHRVAGLKKGKFELKRRYKSLKTEQ
ncbi:MAG: hypothetical protein D6714_03665 [Bacteroidetes bacterium]|nr:MAG: hypothetical protein D6714_03665 [Bacteroidota bacterium]